MTRHSKPWLLAYDAGQPENVVAEHATALDMFRSSVSRSPQAPMLLYFGRTLTVSDVEQMSDAFAFGLREGGVGDGDRVAVYLQNVPQYVIAMVAIWKLGGVMVPVNAMYRDQELRVLLTDSGAAALICHENLYGDVAAHVVGATSVSLVITTSELDFQDEHDPRLFADVVRERHDGTVDLVELIARHRGRRPAPVILTAASLAMLAYTSGTTGPPKGAMNTHGNIAFNAQVYRQWLEISEDEVMLGLAPLFHITGLIGHMSLCLLVPAPLVLGYRFHAGVYLDLIHRHRVSFAIGSITAYTALMNHPDADKLTGLQKVYTGGQSVPPALAEEFERKTGAYLHIAYGLTETTSPTHFVPLHGRSPVDPQSGTLSIGVPVHSTSAIIVDEQGAEVAPGQLGELRVAGPQLVPGYWGKPEETASAFQEGWFATGDVAVMDAQGWFYIVDRKKDMINVSGNKVWPREVEDALYTHPAVLEAAVIGVPDDYRGETVKAFVSLRPGHRVTAAELQALCRSRMAAYKAPRAIEFREELPKTPTGKILRRDLRERSPGAS